MANFERKTTINASVKKVFAYITNPVNQIEFIPSITDIRDVNGEKGVGQRYGWTYKMMGIPLNGQAVVTEYILNERYIWKSVGGILSTWDWTFKPDFGRTEVHLLIEYSIPVPVLNKMGDGLIQKLNEREADLAIAIIKARLER